ncbi:MAG: hypothetical protein LBD10_01090 [Desulfobulbus sp.]|jgi:hypothetical protein|uniref:hypothetical protein n=1 Tax=Desulfobulbus sp. TaxID=895 RepID=UPI00284AE150|nr:hypothetical protein [Desulfobulbus sp.]MDR2548789.1 hypothetical protein [Desulfobulbus sp.]
MPEAPSSTTPYTVNPELKSAVAEAQLLLAFASRNGKSLTEETVNIVVKSGVQSELTEAEETAFWRHFALLTAAVAPVSAESVQAMASLAGQKSPVQKTVQRYTVTAIVALAVLVMLQAYWAVGAFVISDMKSTQAQLSEVEMRILAGGKTSGDSLEPGLAHEGAQESGRRSRRQNAASESMELKTKKENLEIYLDANYHWLKLWSRIPNTILGIDTMCDPNNSPEDAIKENIAYLQSATVTMDILQKYLLPLVYGFLGACVYILRNLSSKIKAYAFINASIINFHIRLCLGTLGGIAIVWFVSPEKGADPILSLSPLALAFLAGYSVELLFTVMDTVINAFTGDNASSPKEEKKG